LTRASGGLVLPFSQGKKAFTLPPKDIGRLALVKAEFLAHLGDEGPVNIGRIHLALKRAHPFAVAVALFTV
jgi:hypothetical protein